MSLLETGFLSRSARSVSAMASVLGASRGSGGLSSQLKCKSKRRRRRRSKRKGKDLAFCAAPLTARSSALLLVSAGAACFGSSTFGAGGASVQSRARRSSDPFVKGRGFCELRGDGEPGTGNRAAGSAKPGLGAA